MKVKTGRQGTRRASVGLLPTTTIALLLGIAALALSGCGLPSPLGVIYAPQLPYPSFSADNVNYFQFANTAQTISAQSYGFELYYKLYDISAGTGGYVADLNKMNSDFSSTTPPQNVASYLTGQLGYYRVVFSNVGSGYTYGQPLTQPQYSSLQTVPLVAIDPAQMGSIFTATIDFSTANKSSLPTDVFPTVALNPSAVSASATSITIARLLQIPGSPGSYMLRGFGSGDFYAGDPDLPPTLASSALAGTTVTTLQIGMIAVAYANDVINTKQYFSNPLGLTTISYPYVVLGTP